MRFLPSGFLICAILGACTGVRVTDPSLPGKGVEVVVDSAVYHLQPNGTNSYKVNVLVTVINDSAHDIYLAQHCGYYSVRRADGSSTELGSYGCALPGGVPMPAPVRIAAGTRYSNLFSLLGSVQPQARPQITLEDNVGKMKFIYGFTNLSGSASSALESVPFNVLPPA